MACYKCKNMIKPVSLAASVAGEKYHPTCVSCALCDKPLWGKGFRVKGNEIVCEEGCLGGGGFERGGMTPRDKNFNVWRTPEQRTPSVPLVKRPSSAQRQQEQLIQARMKEQNEQEKKEFYESVVKPVRHAEESNSPPKETNIRASVSEVPLDPPAQKCSSCGRYILFNKKYDVDENGQITCQKCIDDKAAPKFCICCGRQIDGVKVRLRDVGNHKTKSRHRSVTSMEPQTPDELVCQDCESGGKRCVKCNLLFKLDEVATCHPSVSNGQPYHEACFTCWLCNKPIQSQQFNLTESSLPMCTKCHTNYHLPKCDVCNRPLTEEYMVIDGVSMHSECFKCAQCQIVMNEDDCYRDMNTGSAICGSCNARQNSRTRRGKRIYNYS